jgi:homogentisate 1,2-dioxygenase
MNSPQKCAYGLYAEQLSGTVFTNPQDFKAPVAAFEDREIPSTITVKWCGQFHKTEIEQSPLDIVAWHGNYALVSYHSVGTVRCERRVMHLAQS